MLQSGAIETQLATASSAATLRFEATAEHSEETVAWHAEASGAQAAMCASSKLQNASVSASLGLPASLGSPPELLFEPPLPLPLLPPSLPLLFPELLLDVPPLELPVPPPLLELAPAPLLDDGMTRAAPPARCDAAC